jgi:hypothetical protein
VAASAPATRIRGKVTAYNVATIAAIDENLTRLTTSWSELLKVSPPTDKMRDDYQHDLNLLLEKRLELQR